MDKNVDLISLIWFFYSTLIVLTYPWLSPNNYCIFCFVCFLNLASTLMSWQIRNKALLSLKCESHWLTHSWSCLQTETVSVLPSHAAWLPIYLNSAMYVRACQPRLLFTDSSRWDYLRFIWHCFHWKLLERPGQTIDDEMQQWVKKYAKYSYCIFFTKKSNVSVPLPIICNMRH